MESKEKPLLHLFAYNKGFYVYDTNRNRLMRVSKSLFSELSTLQNIGIGDYISIGKNTESSERRAIIQMLEKGYFSASNLEYMEYPGVEYTADLLRRSVDKVILQITRDCNFDCRYCVFAGNGKYTRTHEARRMDFSVIKAAIDFVSQNSSDSKTVYITFYGGEPFLEFESIKKATKYALKTIQTKDVVFNATTNASLLTDEIIDYLETLPFDLLISLDGPEEIHNSNRRFRKTGEGTFELVMNKIENLKSRHRSYFERNVSFNAVVMQKSYLPRIEAFFKEEMQIPDKRVRIQYADLTGVDYINRNNDFYQDLYVKDEIETTYTEKISNFSDFLETFNDKSMLPPVWHHNGPCIPGVQRLFVNYKGDFYPCEKAFETSPCMEIGNVFQGFDYSKIKELMNIGQLSKNECNLCWAKRYCDICAAKCVDLETGEISSEKKLYMCNDVRERTHRHFINYIRKKLE